MLYISRAMGNKLHGDINVTNAYKCLNLKGAFIHLLAVIMMDIRKRYKIICRLYNDELTDIESKIEKHPFPHSMMCLYAKVRQIEQIKQAIDRIENNFYVSQLLLRSLLEHYLIGYYVYFKTYSCKNDEVGTEFYDEYFKSEIIKRENYYYNLDKIKGEEKHESIHGYLEKYGELFTDSTQAKIDQIHQKASQFNNIRKIIKYLFNQEEARSEELEMHKMLFDFLEKYNKLSSYVHGGVSAEAETFNKDSQLERQIKIDQNRLWGISIESPIKYYFLFLLNFQKPNEILKLKEFLKE